MFRQVVSFLTTWRSPLRTLSPVTSLRFHPSSSSSLPAFLFLWAPSPSSASTWALTWWICLSPCFHPFFCLSSLSSTQAKAELICAIYRLDNSTVASASASLCSRTKKNRVRFSFSFSRGEKEKCQLSFWCAICLRAVIYHCNTNAAQRFRTLLAWWTRASRASTAERRF